MQTYTKLGADFVRLVEEQVVPCDFTSACFFHISTGAKIWPQRVSAISGIESYVSNSCGKIPKQQLNKGAQLNTACFVGVE